MLQWASTCKGSPAKRDQVIFHPVSNRLPFLLPIPPLPVLSRLPHLLPTVNLLHHHPHPNWKRKMLRCQREMPKTPRPKRVRSLQNKKVLSTTSNDSLKRQPLNSQRPGASGQRTSPSLPTSVLCTLNRESTTSVLRHAKRQSMKDEV